MDASLPTDPTILKQLRSAIEEIVVCLTKIDMERNKIKEIQEMIKEEFEFPPAAASKLARMYHKNNAEEVVKDVEQLSEMYEKIFGE